jgi:diketogulonate reductase-like aldo/keto reductase
LAIKTPRAKASSVSTKPEQLQVQPVITAPIVGATKLQHLDDALAPVRIKLSEEEIALLEEPYIPNAVVGFD